MNRRHTKIAVILLLVLGVLLVPRAVHAANPLGLVLGGISEDVFINATTYLLSIVQRILLWGIDTLSGWLQGVINMDPSGGGAIIYTAWRTLRDLCNMAFIIALILISFGTIFNSLDIGFLKSYSIHRGVLVNFLVAAILINFSLAIGQTVMATSNRVSDLVIGLLPKNIGPQIVQQLRVSEVALGSISATANGRTAPLSVPSESLPPSQFYEVKQWPEGQQQLLTACLNGELSRAVGTAGATLKPGVNLSTPSGCFEAVKSIGPDAYAVSGAAAGGLRQSKLSSIIEGWFWTRWGVASNFTAGRVATATKTTSKLSSLTGYIFSTIMLMSLLISFFVMFVFMLIRLPAIWILLALSPLAWTSLAFPGTDGFKGWWKQFWAWNLFSPLYIFMLYLGMLLLQNTNSAVASLGAQDQVFISSFGVAFQYLMAGIVFIGGTGIVLKASFLAGTSAGAWVNRLTKFTGIGGDAGAFGPVGRFLGSVTGATAAYKGAVGGISSKISELPLIGSKSATRRQEEIEARFRRLGGLSDRGALEALQQKRIKEESKKIEERGLSTQDIKDRFKKAAEGSPEYFALGQSLLKEGELSGAEMQDLGKNAQKLGTIGQNALRQQIAKKVSEQVKEKKFRDDKSGTPGAKTASEKAKDAFTALTGDKEKEKFLQDLKKNQLAVYAQLASDNDVKALMLSKNIDVEGGKVRLGNEIIESNTSKLEADDIPAVMKLAKQQGWTLGSNFDYRVEVLLNDKNNVSKMMDAADTAGKEQLRKQLDKLKEQALELEKQKAKITAEATVRAQRQPQGGNEPPPPGGTPPAAPSGAVPTPPQAPAGRPARPRVQQAPTTPPPTPPQGAGSSRSAPPQTSAPGAARAGRPNQTSISVHVNGRFFGTVSVPANASEATIELAAKGVPAVAQELQGKNYRTSRTPNQFNFEIT